MPMILRTINLYQNNVILVFANGAEWTTCPFPDYRKQQLDFFGWHVRLKNTASLTLGYEHGHGLIILSLQPARSYILFASSGRP